MLSFDFNLAAPDLNSKNLFSGFTLTRSGIDFSFSKDEQLEFRLFWEGGENNLRIEIIDEKGHGRMAERVHLSRRKGWQEIRLSPRDMEIWGGKPLEGDLGRIRSLKMVVSYSWTAGPGRMVLDRISVVKRRPSAPVIGVSQLGYAPSDRKRLVVRDESGSNSAGRFRVVELASGTVAVEGALKADAFADWSGRFLTGDFSSVTAEGRYQVELDFGAGYLFKSEPFTIESRILDKATGRLAFEFLHAMRSEDPLVFGLPELGGYRDAGTMLARYINTNTHLLYGIAGYVLARDLPRTHGGKIRHAIDELRYGTRSMLAWQKEDGSVIASIVRDPDIYPHNQFPQDNTYPWKILEGGHTTLTYTAAMASASRALVRYDPDLAALALAAARKSLILTERQALPGHSGAQGNYLWDLMEMYKTTGEAKHLDQARKIAGTLLTRQFLDYTRTPAAICGNLSFSAKSEEFGFQYKLIHEVGMYFGLIELARTLKPTDPLAGDLRFFLRTFASQYLARMSSLTPYRQIAEGLERNEDGTFRVSYFHPPTARLGVQGHGLNCDRLAYALMALRIAPLLNDPDLKAFAADQVQWIFGANPLGLSMMTGVGARQGEVLDEYLGLTSIPGGIMNGIVGEGGKEPYWAHHWVSGEYWLPHNAYYLPVLGEMEWERPAPAEISPPNILIRIERAETVSGQSPLEFTVVVKNTSATGVDLPIIIRSRGAFSAEEKNSVHLGPGEEKSLKRSLNPAGRRAPCLVSVLVNGEVLADEFILPEFPPYTPPYSSDLIRFTPVKAEASSVQKEEKDVTAAMAIDGSMTTRWGSEFRDPQWISVDLGAKKSVRRIVLNWENAFGQSYKIQASDDGAAWRTIHSVDDEDGGRDEIVLPEDVEAKFLRIQCERRGTDYGYSLFEIDVYGRR